MLNPSLFEGWSTTVEEARSLGVRLVVSDLPVHREQLGSAADFFNPHDPQAIAATLRTAWSRLSEPPTLTEQAAAAADGQLRIRLFAQDFTRACARVAARGRHGSNGHDA